MENDGIEEESSEEEDEEGDDSDESQEENIGHGTSSSEASLNSPDYSFSVKGP